MKKSLITLSLIACAALLSAQSITIQVASEKFTQDATVTIKAKATIPAADETADVVCKNPFGSFDIWLPAGATEPTITGSQNGSTTLDYSVTPANNTKPPHYEANNLVCGAAFDHYTITVAAGQSLNPGTYTLTINWENNACAASGSTTLMNFEISAPLIPVLTISNNICETDPLVITTAWKTAAGDTATTPAGLMTIGITDYVAYLDKDFCGDEEWHLPEELGLGAATIVLDPTGTTTIPGTGPGKAVFHINQIQYTTENCGTVTLNNLTKIVAGDAVELP